MNLQLCGKGYIKRHFNNLNESFSLGYDTMSKKQNQLPEEQILKLFIKNAEFEQRLMKKATNLSDPTLIKYLKKLEKDQVIACVREVPI